MDKPFNNVDVIVEALDNADIKTMFIEEVMQKFLMFLLLLVLVLLVMGILIGLLLKSLEVVYGL